jgi:uncharacterized protein YkwD
MKHAILAAAFLAAACSAALAQPDFPRPPARLYRPATDAPADFSRAAEGAIAEAIMRERRKFAPGAPILAPDPDLTQIAQTRSQNMADGAAFAHEDGEGHFIAADLVRTRFGPYGFIGENIMEMGSTAAFSAEAFAKAAVDGWMNSPGHRKNILDPDYNQSGIGVAIRGGKAYATQVFFGPSKHAKRNAL